MLQTCKWNTMEQGHMSLWKVSIGFLRTLGAGVRGDEKGQDMIEYALLAAAVAVMVAAVVPNQVVPIISTTFSKINASMNAS